jgi:D-tagatose-1,6-bisphosphate aldolase subunit GatZ/KbaZ
MTRPGTFGWNWLRGVIDRNRGGESVGLYSVCSANVWVLEAAMHQALHDGSVLTIESTSNQVNQFGGYTGLTPVQFMDFVRVTADRVGLPQERILLGGDHLGPYPWRNEPAETALQKAGELVRACVLSGYSKIHLDASMGCGDDAAGRPLADEVIAERAAALCQLAERASGEFPEGTPAPLYIIGTEVPTPGGEQGPGLAPAVTRVEDARTTLEHFRSAFLKRGLRSAWERVIGLVVQPGVEFGDASVFEYDRQKAQALSKSLPASPSLAYEAHSTDYQLPSALRQMVEDQFAILKVGPWLTFAFREAVFALSEVEREWLGMRRSVTLSHVREELEQAMLRNPAHWRPYYQGEEPDLQLARRYSYSDRCRYYWPDPSVQRELEILLANLSACPPPLTLLSQYLPEQYDAARAGMLSNDPASLVHHRIRKVVRIYAAACGVLPSARAPGDCS